MALATSTELHHAPQSTIGLWRADHNELIHDFSRDTRRIFEDAPETAPAIIIPTRDGFDTLPATLIAMARLNHPVRPIVAANGENQDDTLEVAERMGAIPVYRSYPSKTSGMKAGLEYVFENLPRAGVIKELGLRAIFETDDDTRVYEGWVASGLERIHKIGRPCVIFGTVFFRGHINKIGLNTWRNSIANGKQVVSALTGKKPGSRGANMVLGISTDDEIEIFDSVINSDDSEIEDRMFRDSFGLEPHVNLDLRARVDTPDNRYDSWWQWIRVHRGKDSVESVYNGEVGIVNYRSTPPV